MKVLKARKATLLFEATFSNNIEIYALPYVGGSQNKDLARNEIKDIRAFYANYLRFLESRYPRLPNSC